MTPLQTIKLKPKEQKLYDGIDFSDALERISPEDRVTILDRAGQLTEGLLKRDAVPPIRLSYFTDPAMNIGGQGKSRKHELEQFCGADVYRHASFLDYLHYFIYGPKLAPRTIDGFVKIMEDNTGTPSMVLNQICAFVRKEVRDCGPTTFQTGDEFAKLAYEINQPDLAVRVKHAAETAVR